LRPPPWRPESRRFSVSATKGSRTKAIWTGAITVALAAVVLIGFGLAGPLFRPSVPASTNIGSAQGPEAAKGLYDRALAAQQSGDTTRALALARAALAASPSNQAAQELVTVLTAGSQERSTRPNTPPASTAATKTQVPAGDAVWLKPIANLRGLVPSSYPDYSIGMPSTMKGDVSVTGVPDNPNAAVSNLLWAVHDFKTEAKAKAFVTKTSKDIYSEGGGLVQVDGIKGYYGTDGTRLATVAYVRGRYVFELIITVSKPSGLDSLKPVAVGAASAFVDAPAK